jgi:predicted lipid carrier protein YhbT
MQDLDTLWFQRQCEVTGEEHLPAVQSLTTA